MEYGAAYEQDESICDGKDNDCDGKVDERLVRDCPKQEGVCDAAAVPCRDGEYRECGAEEYGDDYEADESTCDGLDNDCDGEVDEGLAERFWRDDDGDGCGDPDDSRRACPPAPDGFVANDDDCAPDDPDEPGMDGECSSEPGDPSGGDTGAGSADDAGFADASSTAGDDTQTGGVRLTSDDKPESDGCGCTTGGGPRRPALPWLAAALGLAALHLRRR